MSSALVPQIPELDTREQHGSLPRELELSRMETCCLRWCQGIRIPLRAYEILHHEHRPHQAPRLMAMFRKNDVAQLVRQHSSQRAPQIGRTHICPAEHADNLV